MANAQPSGPIGEAGATARSLIGQLGGNPIVLASVVVNLGLIALLYVEAVTAERERGEERKLLYENRREVAHLLAACHLTPDGDPLPVPPARPFVPTPQKGGFRP